MTSIFALLDRSQNRIANGIIMGISCFTLISLEIVRSFLYMGDSKEKFMQIV